MKSRINPFINPCLVAVFLLTFSAASALAQRNEVGFVVGGAFSPDTSPNKGTGACPIQDPNCASPVKTSSSFAAEGNFAHRILNLRVASLSLEFPIVGVTNRDTRRTILQPGTLDSGAEFTQIFFTPSLKLKLALPLVSPFVSAGGGLAHFGSIKLSNGIPRGGSTQGAFQVGGGVDVGTPIPHIGLRGEVREFFTGEPDFSTTSRHNIFAGGGVVLRF